MRHPICALFLLLLAACDEQPSTRDATADAGEAGPTDGQAGEPAPRADGSRDGAAGDGATGDAATPRPTMYVAGSALHDRCGEKVVLRG